MQCEPPFFVFTIPIRTVEENLYKTTQTKSGFSAELHFKFQVHVHYNEVFSLPAPSNPLLSVKHLIYFFPSICLPFTKKMRHK